MSACFTAAQALLGSALIREAIRSRALGQPQDSNTHGTTGVLSFAFNSILSKMMSQDNKSSPCAGKYQHAKHRKVPLILVFVTCALKRYLDAQFLFKYKLVHACCSLMHVLSPHHSLLLSIFFHQQLHLLLRASMIGCGLRVGMQRRSRHC